MPLVGAASPSERMLVERQPVGYFEIKIKLDFDQKTHVRTSLRCDFGILGIVYVLTILRSPRQLRKVPFAQPEEWGEKLGNQ